MSPEEARLEMLRQHTRNRYTARVVLATFHDVPVDQINEDDPLVEAVATVVAIRVGGIHVDDRDIIRNRRPEIREGVLVDSARREIDSDRIATYVALTLAAMDDDDLWRG